MSNIITQFSRRISKYWTDKSESPVVAVPGTNHVDDASTWTNQTIYQGEIGINLYTGQLYTSDSKQIIALNTENAIINGMQVVSIEGAGGDADPLYIRITNGYVRINGVTYRHKAVVQADNAPGDITVLPTSSYGRYDLIYASSGYPNRAEISDTAFYKAKITVVNGSTNLTDLFNVSYVETQLNNAGLFADESVLLGIVYVPANYSSASGFNHLRPWSWGVSAEGTSENYLNYKTGQSINAPAITPGTLLSNVITSITTHHDAGADLRKRYTYLAGQILSYDNGNITAPDKKLYKVLRTHFCTSLSASISNNDIAAISGTIGSPGSGTANHSELFELGFNESGHTGFQRKTINAARNPNAGDSSIPPSVSYETAEIGTLWVNTITYKTYICVIDTPNAAVWATAFASIQDTASDKKMDCLVTTADGSLATTLGISTTPVNNSYVKVEINGVGIDVGDNTKLNCSCYFSGDSGVTPRAIIDIQVGDKVYWNGSIAGYQLATDDEISLYYLMSTDGINDTIDFITGGGA
ncbi:MAG: hypothetical protein WC979_00845 [Candidatus Pacearchaeota archaeon]|jgi:hypothetical protein|nr:hypothetical protein [Clostridia bacterium]